MTRSISQRIPVRKRTEHGLVPMFRCKGKDYKFLPRVNNQGLKEVLVFNESEHLVYKVTPHPDPEKLLQCDCPDYQARGQLRECKHIKALLAIEQMIRDLIISRRQISLEKSFSSPGNCS